MKGGGVEPGSPLTRFWMAVALLLALVIAAGYAVDMLGWLLAEYGNLK